MKNLLITLGSLIAGVLLFAVPFVAAAGLEEGSSNEWSTDDGIPSLQICTDGIDNDEDGLADSADPGCAPYYRVLSVVKHVVGTTTAPSMFSFTVTGNGVPSLGTFAFEQDGENNYLNTLIGEYHITEVNAPGYTVAYDNCGSGTAGDNALTIPLNGVEETCTITNTWIASTPGTTTPPVEGTSTPPTSTTTPTTDTSGGSNNEGGSKHHRGGRSSGSSGSVLGAATCGPLLSDYLKKGSEGGAVSALQEFLNKELGLSLSLSGVFDDATEQAVNAFQVKYWEEVLAPWVKFGLATDHTPTGFVYKTTVWKINALFCEALQQEVPELP